MKWSRTQKCEIYIHYYTGKNCVYRNLHLKGCMLGTKSIIQGEERKQWITQKIRDSRDQKICWAAFLTDGSICIFQENKTKQNKTFTQTNKSENKNLTNIPKPQKTPKHHQKNPQTNRKKTFTQRTKSIGHKENWVFKLILNNKGFSLLWRMELDGTKSRFLLGGIEILHSLTLSFSHCPAALTPSPWSLSQRCSLTTAREGEFREKGNLM